MTPQERFTTHLRRHRERNRISLDELALETRVKRELFEDLERNDLSAWPHGLYARAWVRAYASAVGLDPIDTVDEFCRLFPQGDRRTQRTIEEIATIVAQPSDYRDEILHEDRRRPAPSPDAEETVSRVDGRRTPRINMLSNAPWHAPLTQALRAAWARVATLGPQPRRSFTR